MFTPSRLAAVLGVGYLALLVVGLVAVRRREPAAWTRRQGAEWVASRDLAAFTQLDSADLAAPDDTTGKALPDRARLAGRHLVRDRRKGEPVSGTDVAPLSVGEPRPGMVRFVLAARPGEVPTLAMARPGDRLSPCVAVTGGEGAPTTWDCNGGPFTVVALYRRPGTPDSIWALLEAASADEAARFAGTASRLLVRR